MNVSELPEYSVAIRTLGKAGKKYQTLLDSLLAQTHKPKKIFVYLAEGYDKPKETIGIEEIVYVSKGMVAQRALPYDEIETEWILFSDDDVSIAPDGVERLFKDGIRMDADVVVPDAFPRKDIPLSKRLFRAAMLISFPRFSGEEGKTVSILGTDCYNRNSTGIRWSTTGAGMNFLVRKKDFLNIQFNEELWLDEAPYSLPDDKVMFYKMHLNGLKILTQYNSSFKHLDAQSAVKDKGSRDRAHKITYSSARNNMILYHKYVLPNLSPGKKAWSRVLRAYNHLAYSSVLIALKLIGNDHLSHYLRGRRDGRAYLANMSHK